MFEIRPYEPQRDALRVYMLWQHTLGQLCAILKVCLDLAEFFKQDPDMTTLLGE